MSKREDFLTGPALDWLVVLAIVGMMASLLIPTVESRCRRSPDPQQANDAQ